MPGISAIPYPNEIEGTSSNRTNEPADEQDFCDQLDQIKRGGVVLDIALLQRHGAANVALDQSDAQEADKQKLVANQPEGKF